MGIPGMAELAAHLNKAVPDRIIGLPKEVTDCWAVIAAKLEAGDDLETAMTNIASSGDLMSIIAEETADLIEGRESEVIGRILTQPDVEPLGLLLRHIASTNRIADVITPNYDRLIEVCAARAGLRVDTLFYGHTVGRLDKQLSSSELLKPIAPVVVGRASIKLTFYDKIRLSKPHGSLDWYFVNGECLRSSVKIQAERRIIVPGNTKYEAGYSMPYDAHRQRATDALDNATALLFIGYGFNDRHLQTHLKPDAGLPSLVISRTLSVNARAFIAANPNALGLEAETIEGVAGTRTVTSTGEGHIAGIELWKLQELNKRVLRI